MHVLKVQPVSDFIGLKIAAPYGIVGDEAPTTAPAAAGRMGVQQSMPIITEFVGSLNQMRKSIKQQVPHLKSVESLRQELTRLVQDPK